MHDRTQRIKSWITDLPAENFVDPETSLPTPASLSGPAVSSPLLTQNNLTTIPPVNNTTSQDDKFANTMPQFPFLDSPPMDSRLPKGTMSRFDYGHHGHFEPIDRTPIRGNFIPISKSVNVRSPSPHHQQDPHVSHVVQLSLTDSQMDRLTSV